MKLITAIIKPFKLDDVREALSDVQLDGGENGPEIDPDWGEESLTPAERAYGWNSFAILAMKSGVPEAPVNAIVHGRRVEVLRQARVARGRGRQVREALAFEIRAQAQRRQCGHEPAGEKTLARTGHAVQSDERGPAPCTRRQGQIDITSRLGQVGLADAFRSLFPRQFGTGDPDIRLDSLCLN